MFETLKFPFINIFFDYIIISEKQHFVMTTHLNENLQNLI